MTACRANTDGGDSQHSRPAKASNELENVISLCPGVIECAAVGVPDEKQGEAIKVFVVRRDASVDEEAVQRYCQDKLTGYKRPKFIEFRESLPKTNVGKILRRELRGPVIAGH